MCMADQFSNCNKIIGFIHGNNGQSCGLLYAYNTFVLIRYNGDTFITYLYMYASCVWCPHLKKDRDLIEQVQRRATRLVPETKGLPYNSRLIGLQLPTLNYRRQRTDIIQTFKIIKKIDSVNHNYRCPQCPSKLMLKKASGTTRG